MNSKRSNSYRMMVFVLVVSIPAIMAGQCCQEDDPIIKYADDVFVGIGDIDGLKVRGEIYADQEITFYVGLIDEIIDEDINGLRFALRIYSPEGATWNTTTAELYPEAAALNPSITYYHITGSLSDTVGYEGNASVGNSLESFYSDDLMTITIGPIDDSFVGKQICIDKSDFPPGLPWLWSASRSA
ncbi:MAG: hypothetical protein P1R58_09370 [bacterium]|nr:hypothetical protein [bacterium]